MHIRGLLLRAPEGRITGRGCGGPAHKHRIPPSWAWAARARPRGAHIFDRGIFPRTATRKIKLWPQRWDRSQMQGPECLIGAKDQIALS